MQLTCIRIGTPLPPMPKPLFGPAKSGLKRYRTVEDALRPLLHQEPRLHDKYHQPHLMQPMNGEPKDPHTTMANCITTNGGDNLHYSGERRYTVLELAGLQGLPSGFYFCGSTTEATRQIGNCWSPTSSKYYFLDWAATLEAFDNGLIDAEDEIDNLYEFLEQKNVDFGKPRPIEIDNPFDDNDRNAGPAENKYRYISKLEKPVKPRVPLVLWARKQEIQRRPSRAKKAATSVRTGRHGLTNNNRSSSLTVRSRSASISARPGRTSGSIGSAIAPSPAQPQRRRTATRTTREDFWSGYTGETIEVSDDEE